MVWEVSRVGQGSTVSNTGAWRNINPIVTIITFPQYEVCVLYEDLDEGGASPGRELEFTGRRLSFWLTETCPVTLSICDPVGRVVARPVDGVLLGPARHSVDISSLAPGVYFAQLESAEAILFCRFAIR